MDGGGVSRAILRSGGEQIQIDAQRKLPARVGDVVVSTAGNLRHQKYVFHCLTKRYGAISARDEASDDNTDIEYSAADYEQRLVRSLKGAIEKMR
ncbi:MAG: macro domain-containing protein [Alistipes sp.]|nr:macro domain-containing protein [Alistipes sp.]